LVTLLRVGGIDWKDNGGRLRRIRGPSNSSARARICGTEDVFSPVRQLWRSVLRLIRNMVLPTGDSVLQDSSDNEIEGYTDLVAF
jgi:hypothetical protein